MTIRHFTHCLLVAKCIFQARTIISKHGFLVFSKDMTLPHCLLLFEGISPPQLVRDTDHCMCCFYPKQPRGQSRVVLQQRSTFPLLSGIPGSSRKCSRQILLPVVSSAQMVSRPAQGALTLELNIRSNCSWMYRMGLHCCGRSLKQQHALRHLLHRLRHSLRLRRRLHCYRVYRLRPHCCGRSFLLPNALRHLLRRLRHLLRLRRCLPQRRRTPLFFNFSLSRCR